jgi:hypothetical protein
VARHCPIHRREFIQTAFPHQEWYGFTEDGQDVSHDDITVYVAKKCRVLWEMSMGSTL